MRALVIAVALLAPATPKERADAAFKAGDYKAAIEALEEAYQADPQPRYIFAQGSAYQELGQCEEAIEAYERFLATSPPQDQAQKAFDRIQECRAKLPAAKDPEPTPVPEPEPTEPDPVPADPTQEGDRPWHRDVLGGVLLGVGLGVAGTGGALVGVGASRRVSADDASTEDGFRSDVRSSNVLQGVGIGLAVTGGALIVGAVVRYALLRRNSPDRLSRRVSGLTLRF